MANQQNTKPLSTMALKAMKPGNKVLVDTGENRGLRVRCGKGGTTTFFYRYTSPLTHKLAQIVIGHFPGISLADARLKLQDLKFARGDGRCPATEQNLEKQKLKDAPKEKGLTVKQLVELYLKSYIEDRKVGDKLTHGARKNAFSSFLR